ncbi:hypothetical protein LEP1GSC088_4449 [Leptospira interrogans str. L1207]|nr:hypothetical protein LEP1GSC088_4449 [Leptospira interrogans str. L1207]
MLGLVKAQKKEIRKSSEECSEDRSKFCKFVIPGGGRILRCLINPLFPFPVKK